MNEIGAIEKNIPVILSSAVKITPKVGKKIKNVFGWNLVGS